MARTVLVADDSPTHQRTANGILAGEGFEVITVSNGVAAIKKLPALKPMVVLADVSMPGKDGYEVCEFVKSSPELRHVPVLLIASDMEPYDQARAARVGADGMVKKPFGRDALVAAVNKFLAQYEAVAPRAQVAIAQPVAPAPPLPAPEPAPEEEEVGAKDESFELGALSEGVAFAEPSLEEAATLPPETPAAVEEKAGVETATAPAPEVEESGLSAEPMLVEETPEIPEPPPEPAFEGTMIFRAPVQIAEPILADELAPPPAETMSEPPPAESESAAAPATTRESFSLGEAADQVSFAAPAAEAAPETEPVPEAAVAPRPELPPEAPTEVPSPPPAAVDLNLVSAIVSRVVYRMAPPALALESVEELARTLSQEVISELEAGFLRPE